MEPSILKLLSGTKNNVPLAPYTTFKIGGKAKYFFTARTAKSVIQAVGTAKKLRIPFFILGGGSNLVVADRGFPGLVIHIQAKKYRIEGTKLFCEAGVPMATLVKETGKKGFSGLEWAGGLPGSVGGAIRGNAGAFGGETKDFILWVIALDENGKERLFSKKECKFSYRSSLFKGKGLVILSAAFALRKGNKRTIQATAKDHISYRKAKHPLEYPNAGSVFKNCDLKKFSLALQKKLQPAVKTDPFPVVPTAYLNDQAGLKGMRQNTIQVSIKHPNYMVNLGQGKAKDVMLLVQKVKKIIKKKFGVELEQEIEFVA
ncbi:MAG: UDP-N-acetylmuramate dehydrogenase [Candidatus Wildermuthbacteria bacterium]|nr:UDP-N-acetylmuramate dehydrogenase [Candidatus Wildermuthbacteria bacterium]